MFNAYNISTHSLVYNCNIWFNY